VVTGRCLGKDDLTLKKMRDDLNFSAVFVGIGNPEPKVIPIFEGLNESNGFYTSKDFLPKVKKIFQLEKKDEIFICDFFSKVSKASKPGMCACKSELPKLHGTVVVLGAGDTAFDCATSALR
jgi:dihydropyrimidine dehydrogenase (NADP+)